MAQKKIAFMGLGLMGSPMAKHLIARKAFDVTVWNRTAEKLSPFKGLGAHLSTSAEEAISRSDVIITMLWDYQSVSDTLALESDTTSLKGKTVIQASTISSDENLKLNDLVVKAGGSFVECPVLGTSTVAEAKNLQCLVGTTPEKFAEVEDILLSFGPVVRRIGDVGRASSIKLAFNQIVAGTVSTFATSLAMVVKQDLPVEIFMEILRNSAIYCKYHDMKLPSMLSRNFENALFYTSGALKDIKLISRDCKKLGIDTTSLDGLESLLEKASAKYPNLDFGSIYNIINPIN